MVGFYVSLWDQQIKAASIYFIDRISPAAAVEFDDGQQNKKTRRYITIERITRHSTCYLLYIQLYIPGVFLFPMKQISCYCGGNE